MEAATATRTVWRPQAGPQTKLLTCPIEDVMYGGARGGGKTDGVLGDWLKHVKRWGDAARGIFFRRSFTPELEEVIRRSQEIYTPLGAKWHSRGVWTFGKATLRLRHLERDADAQSYQGHSYTWLCFDDMGTWPSPVPIDLLRATLRSGAGVKVRMRATANPGGPGHNWIKERYVSPAPPLTPFYSPNLHGEGGTWRCYIPATLDDNPILMHSNPEYWGRIAASVGDNLPLLQAWRYGDWDIVAGGFFDDLWARPVALPDGRSVPASKVIVVPSFDVPRNWRITRSFDWGSAKPFSCGWWAISDGTPALIDSRLIYFARGSIIRMTELYGWDGVTPNKGVHWTASQIAKKMLEIEESRGWRGRVQGGVADSSIFASENANCIAEDFRQAGILWEPSLKGDRSRENGWAKVRAMLLNATVWPMEHPGMFVTEHCTQFIRTLPVLPRSKLNPEDIDTTAEDHVADEVRYFCLNYTASEGIQILS